MVNNSSIAKEPATNTSGTINYTKDNKNKNLSNEINQNKRSDQIRFTVRAARHELCKITRNLISSQVVKYNNFW